MINYIPRRFTVIRDKELCINCGCCVRQCSNECHFFDEDGKNSISKFKKLCCLPQNVLTSARQEHCV